jgi:hypothetical protein
MNAARDRRGGRLALRSNVSTGVPKKTSDGSRGAGFFRQSHRLASDQTTRGPPENEPCTREESPRPPVESLRVPILAALRVRRIDSPASMRSSPVSIRISPATIFYSPAELFVSPASMSILAGNPRSSALHAPPSRMQSPSREPFTATVRAPVLPRDIRAKKRRPGATQPSLPERQIDCPTFAVWSEFPFPQWLTGG